VHGKGENAVKSSAERSVEALTWAVVIMWLGFALVMHLLGYMWLVVLVLSIILLSSAIYQRSRGWQTSLAIWITGVWMAVFSVLEIVSEFVGALTGGEGLQIDLWVYLGVALISMGAAVVLRFMQAPKLSAATEIGASRRRSQPPSDTYEQPRESRREPRIPRQMQQDLSSGYTPPPQAERSSRRRYTPPPQQQEPVRSQPVESRRQRPAVPPAQEPNDLEARVDDIIRRSRERRDKGNLPY
jgi:hypothetical protein